MRTNGENRSVTICGRKIIFDGSKHIYRADGVILPSVTQILKIRDKSGPLMWYASQESCSLVREFWKAGISYTTEEIEAVLYDAYRAHQKTSRTAADLGTRVHAWCKKYSAYLAGQEQEPDLPGPGRERQMCEEFVKWLDYEVIESERIIYHPEYKYAGTVDAILRKDGRVYIADYKTGKAVYDEAYLQLAAYAEAYSFEQHETITMPDHAVDDYVLLPVHIQECGVQEKPVTNDSKLFNCFLDHMKLYSSSKNLEGIIQSNRMEEIQ